MNLERVFIMECKRINSQNRNLINAFIKQHWHTTTMILRGKEIDMTKTKGFYFSEGEIIIGLITYIVYNNLLEITSLDSLRENQGIGSRLVEAVIHEAKERKCQKIVLITTNDNINAIKFYHSIPLRHEIEFELPI